MITYSMLVFRSVAELGNASALEAKDQRFESSHSDCIYPRIDADCFDIQPVS